MSEGKSLLFSLADALAKKTYKTTLSFPYKYQSSVGDQLRRSCLSVVLNIVEAGARMSLKEKRQLLNISFGSLKETKYLIYFAKEFGQMTESDHTKLNEEVNMLARLMYGILYRKKT
ncbi:MAG: four helix bundle protein [bacterium]|nr:four helix bundle protein [bacterium]